MRKDTSFSMDDFTYGRVLFTQGKVDVACLWEPDVTLALNGRPGSRRLFSTADATELVADVLLARQDLLKNRPEVAEKLARVWFAGVKQAEADKAAAARLIASVVPRFKNELGQEKTLQAFDWVKWTDLADNAAFFGLDGKPPAFDRVYNQADGIWTKYPQAEIKERFVPAGPAQRRHRAQAVGGPGPAGPGQGGQIRAQDRRDRHARVHQAGDHQLRQRGQRARRRVDGHPQQPAGAPAGDGARHVRPGRGQHRQRGQRTLNQSLSEKRAQAIVDYLISRGVERERIVAKGNGDSKPVASNKTSDGRASNRRTDILFISSTSASR